MTIVEAIDFVRDRLNLSTFGAFEAYRHTQKLLTQEFDEDAPSDPHEIAELTVAIYR